MLMCMDSLSKQISSMPLFRTTEVLIDRSICKKHGIYSKLKRRGHLSNQKNNDYALHNVNNRITIVINTEYLLF